MQLIGAAILVSRGMKVLQPAPLLNVIVQRAEAHRPMTFEEAIPELFAVIPRYGARPDIPITTEDFFTELVARFDNRAVLTRHLEELAPGMFRCLRELPDWIQSPNWPLADGRPMVFVGSIDAPPDTFHDDARFYVFWSPEVGTT